MTDDTMTSSSESSQADTPTDQPRRGFKRRLFLGLAMVGAAALVYIWYVGGHVDNRVVTLIELDSGPVTQIVTWDEDHTAVQLSRSSDLPATVLWRVVTDQGRFDEFMPYVRSTTVTDGSHGLLIEKQVLDLPYGSYDLELGIRLTEKDNVQTARWEQRVGTLKFNQGAWVVESHGDRSVLRYQVAAKLRGIPQWMSNFFMTRRLGRLLDAVEARVVELRQSEPDYFKTFVEDGS